MRLVLKANKMDNLKEINKYLQMYNLPWLKQVEKGNMNLLITSNETESDILKSPNKQKCKQKHTGSQVNSTEIGEGD